MTAPTLRWLFLDVNAFFASVEQHMHPELRGRPVGVIPVDAETTCCIACSYEARGYGVKTGISVKKARAACPEIQLVVARPKLYVEFHHKIRAAVESCVPVHDAPACDEFCCKLIGRERTLERATAIAKEIKRGLRDIGPALRCSIGLGPNKLLAKTASGSQKPDGLVAFEQHALPAALYPLALADIPGIGRRMETRLTREGIHTMQALCDLNRQQMASLWGSVLGERLWLELRGEDLPEQPAAEQQTISRQHILPPKFRSREGSRKIALKMLHDCVRRLRKAGRWARGVGVVISFQAHDYAFEAHVPIPASQDAYTLQGHFLTLMEGVPVQAPSYICVILSGLTTQPVSDLFVTKKDLACRAASQAMDQIQKKFGVKSIYLASIDGVQDEAPKRIPFGPPPPLDEF
jgi:DNA polymerase-4